MTGELHVKDLYDVEVPSECRLSPDGTKAVYTLRTVNAEHDRDEYALWLLDVESGTSRRLTTGPSDRSAVWSPDGARLAWISTTDENECICIAEPSAIDEPTRFAEGMKDLTGLHWSPDGTRILALATVDLAEQLGLPTTTDGRGPVVTARLGYKSDGVGYWGTRRVQPHLLEAATGDVTRVVSNDWHYHGAGWHPSGDRLLLVASGEPDSDITGARSIYEVDLARDGGSRPELLTSANGVVIHAQWLDDGSGVLAVGTETTRFVNLRLLLFDREGALVADLSRGIDRSVSTGDAVIPCSVPAQVDGESVLFGALDEGTPRLYRAYFDGRAAEPFDGDAEVGVSSLSLSADGRRAVIRHTSRSFGEVVVCAADGAELCRSNHGERFWSTRTPALPKPRTFVLESGEQVPGWVIRDESLDAPGPLLLDIHGGPNSQWSPLAVDVHWYRQVLAAQGWTVLLLNPKGSDGYGEEFMLANSRAWGWGDQESFLGPVRTLVDEGIADPARLAVVGYSYGGYSVAWLTGHTEMFASAVAGGMVADLVSMSASDISHPELNQMSGTTPWDDWEATVAQSPFVSVSQVRTPTLILQGIAEQRCPVTQAEQWFTALRVRQVPVEMVLYPGESHLMIVNGLPSHREDYQSRIVDWVTRHSG